ncbi:hypothetical protein FCV25MIE_16161 [Fagus crenata]
MMVLQWTACTGAGVQAGREVEAENEASPICEKNGENRDDGGVKERCKENEEEKVVESSSICVKRMMKLEVTVPQRKRAGKRK